MRLDVVTNSELEAFKRCPRLHLYRYLLLRRPRVVPGSLSLGTLVHVGLEAWFKALKSANGVNPIDAAVCAIERFAARAGVDALMLVQATELMIGYHCRWIDEPLEVLGVELEFEIDVVDPIVGSPIGVKLGGKLDALVRLRGDAYIVEHKTSSMDLTPGSFYWQKTELSPQLGFYWLGARSLGYEPAGAIYDVIGKPKDHEPNRATPIEKRKYRRDGQLYKGMAERDDDPNAYRERLRDAIQREPGLFYQRQVVARLQRELDASVRDLSATVELMRVAADIGAHPRSVDRCHDFGRTCEYHGCCTHREDIRDDDKFRTAERAHEELGA